MARNPKTRTKKKPDPKRILADRKGRVRRGRPKICQFCAEHSEWVDYKDITGLRRYLNDRGRIRARGATGTCSQHQRDVAVAIKTARELALLPYALRTLAPGAGDRRGGPRREGPTPIATETAVQTSEAPDAHSSTQDPNPPEDPSPPADLQTGSEVDLVA
jgi:small subunit ribosomal protein S18